MRQYLWLKIITGFSCNFRCLFCVDGDKRSKIQDETYEDICRTIKDNVALVDHVILLWWEPTIRRDIFDIVNYARSCGYKKIKVISNGFLLSDPAMIVGLIGAWMTHLQISFQSFDPDVAAMLAGVADTKRVIAAIQNSVRLCGENNVKFWTNTVINRLTALTLQQTYVWLQRLWVHEKSFTYMSLVGNAAINHRKLAVHPNIAAVRINELLSYVQRTHGELPAIEWFPLCLIDQTFRSVASVGDIYFWSEVLSGGHLRQYVEEIPSPSGDASCYEDLPLACQVCKLSPLCEFAKYGISSPYTHSTTNDHLHVTYKLYADIYPQLWLNPILW